MKTNDENLTSLFLIEFLVDNVHFDSSKIKLDERIKQNLGQTCIKIKFLNYCPLEICEEDLCGAASPSQETDVVFRSGKSCLFSLPSANIFSQPLNVSVFVFRKLKNGEYIDIGCTSINLGSSFAQIFNTGQQACSSPTSKTLKGTYILKDGNSNEVGSVTIFLRLSNFGKMILTQFQVGNEETKSFLFKGATDIEQALLQSETLIRNIGPGFASLSGFPVGGGPSFGPVMGQSFPHIPPGGGQTMGQEGGWGMDPCNAGFLGAAQLGGDQYGMGFPVCPCLGDQEYGFGDPNLSKNCEGKPDSTFYKIATDQNGNKQYVQVTPEGGHVPCEDENNDTFVLKIGRKTPNGEQKTKLELELKTPKLKENKIITQENETQYLETDIPAPKGKGGKGKDSVKGGKGGKKGKKK